MHEKILSDILDRLNNLESSSVRIRGGVIVDDSPLTIDLGDAGVNLLAAQSAGISIGDRIIALEAGNNPPVVLGKEIGLAWTAFTPSYSNFTLGNGTAIGRYIQIGKVVHVRVLITLGSTSSFTGGLYIGQPIATTDPLPGNSGQPDGRTLVRDASDGSQWFGLVQVGSSVELHYGNTYTLITGTAPNVKASGDEIRASWTYEIP